MGIIKGFIFDGINSHLYGLGITGKDVYNSAERDVEVIQIPGRNGDLIRDKKRFNNIDVTYEAGAYDNTQPDFAQKLAELRNALASRVGYKRLEDEYNIEEYRMGYYKGQFETEPTSYQRAGEFDITFSCLPQRFLKSGENEVAITSGGSIVNPTEFESKPLLMVKGYGYIDLNGQDIGLSNSIPLGYVTVCQGKTTRQGSLYLDLSPVLAAGDAFNITASFRYNVRPEGGELESVTPQENVTGFSVNGAEMQFVETVSFVYGTSKTQPIYKTITVVTYNGGTVTTTFNTQFGMEYDGDSTVRVWVQGSATDTDASLDFISTDSRTATAYSSKSTLGDPTYIDLDIGEAYRIDDGEMTPLNDAVSLGAELPTLKPGENPITFGNTITEVKIIPRWWII